MSEEEYAYDLFWHALNYRTAMTLYPVAEGGVNEPERCWRELLACVNRLIERGEKVDE